MDARRAYYHRGLARKAPAPAPSLTCGGSPADAPPAMMLAAEAAPAGAAAPTASRVPRATNLISSE